MQITDIRLVKLYGTLDSSVMTPEERQIGALDLYPEFRDRQVSPSADGTADGTPIESIYIHIDTDEGITGTFGPIFRDVAFQIDMRLRPYLIGQDPLAGERIWDVLSRHDRHARKGTLMMAISAVDIALWDLRGKAAGMPVYRLLGGPTRDAVPAYASMLGHSLEPDRVVERATQFKAMGYKAQKWFFRYGPSHGREAIEKNMTLVRLLRETVGDDIDLMFDAWLGWDVPFAIEMGRRMAEYSPRWLEEPVAPDRIGGYAEIRRATGIPIAGGEHEYTRWGFKVLLDAEGVDVVQADPDWTGGISEMLKICALCSAYERPVFPHGHSVLPALHIIASQSPAVCPMLEYLVIHNESKQWFHKIKYRPENGIVALPTAPGLGIELDEERIKAREDLRWR
ncbi:MAG: enolase C-terminal domain-like protein [Anaerolineae bacterium]